MRRTDCGAENLCSHMRRIGRKLWGGETMDGLVSMKEGAGTGGWELEFSVDEFGISYTVRPHGLGLECVRRLSSGEESAYDITEGVLQGTLHWLHMNLLPLDDGYTRTVYGIAVRLLYPMALEGDAGNELVGRMAKLVAGLGDDMWTREEIRYRGMEEPCLSPVRLGGDSCIRELVHRGVDGCVDMAVSVLVVKYGKGEEMHVCLCHDGYVSEARCMSGHAEYDEFVSAFERLYSVARDYVDHGVLVTGRRTVSVSMQPGMLSWVRKAVKVGKAESVSEYLCGLVRERMEAEGMQPCRVRSPKCPAEWVRKFRDLFWKLKSGDGIRGIRVHSWHADGGWFGCSVDTFCDAEGTVIDNTGSHGRTCPLRIGFEFPLDGDTWRMRWEWRVDGDDGFLSVTRVQDHEYVYDPVDRHLKELHGLVLGGRDWIPRRKGK